MTSSTEHVHNTRMRGILQRKRHSSLQSHKQSQVHIKVSSITEVFTVLFLRGVEVCDVSGCVVCFYPHQEHQDSRFDKFPLWETTAAPNRSYHGKNVRINPHTHTSDVKNTWIDTQRFTLYPKLTTLYKLWSKTSNTTGIFISDQIKLVITITTIINTDHLFSEVTPHNLLL